MKKEIWMVMGSGRYQAIETLGGARVATLCQRPGFDLIEQEARAHLIAAAPDMLEALKAAIEEIRTFCPLGSDVVADRIHAQMGHAINKAEGWRTKATSKIECPKCGDCSEPKSQWPTPKCCTACAREKGES